MEAFHYFLKSSNVVVPKPLHSEMHVILLYVTLFYFFLELLTVYYVDMGEEIMYVGKLCRL